MHAIINEHNHGYIFAIVQICLGGFAKLFGAHVLKSLFFFLCCIFVVCTCFNCNGCMQCFQVLLLSFIDACRCVMFQFN